MNTTTAKKSFFLVKFKLLILLLVIMGMGIVSAQTNPATADSTKTTVTFGDIKLPKLGSIESKYTYDPILDRYIYNEKIGKFNINYPLILTPEEFKKY